MGRILAIMLFVASCICTVPTLAQDTTPKARVFQVEGMTCPLCSKVIEKTLRGVEGVESVQIDPKAETVTIVADAALSPERLEKAIESAGAFEAKLVQ
jgi:copper chaperone CopZ